MLVKFWPYIIRNVLRNKVRTLLTTLGVTVAVGIFCLLASIEASMHRTIDDVAQQSLLVVNEKDQW